MRLWLAIRSGISVVFIAAIGWAAIADWPGCALWQIVMQGNAYWLWELLILFVAWHGCISWTIYLERSMSNTIRRIVIVKRKEAVRKNGS